ncbi:hypothetical protein [Cetobacterium sp.]|uniref:hypothetical protein n=1 Tax=Cetobacterium sp. TaxID=2071632 RepID=UPI003F37903E
MIGIPVVIATKKDMQNLQNMVLENLIDRKEWIKVLENMLIQNVYKFPVLEKELEYIVLPYSELLLEHTNNETQIIEDGDNKTIKIFIENYEKDFIEITGGFLELERLGLSVEEVNKMIEEVNN